MQMRWRVEDMRSHETKYPCNQNIHAIVRELKHTRKKFKQKGSYMRWQRSAELIQRLKHIWHFIKRTRTNRDDLQSRPASVRHATSVTDGPSRLTARALLVFHRVSMFTERASGDERQPLPVCRAAPQCPESESGASEGRGRWKGEGREQVRARDRLSRTASRALCQYLFGESQLVTRGRGDRGWRENRAARLCFR